MGDSYDLGIPLPATRIPKAPAHSAGATSLGGGVGDVLLGSFVVGCWA